MPGRYQTGSIAALVTATSPVSCTIVAVDLEPALAPIASSSSGSVSRALVIAMRRADVDALGDLLAEILGDAMAPRDRARRCAPGSDHCGNGPISTTGEVLVRSGRAIGFSAPDETASAR